MAKRHGRNFIVHAWDNAGGSQNITPDLTSVTLSFTRDNPAVTTFGKDSVQRISGIRDATVTGAAVYDNETITASLLRDLQSSSTVTLLRLIPAGSTTGCPMWTGCFLLSAYEETAPIDGPVAATFTFQLASGSLSASVI